MNTVGGFSFDAMADFVQRSYEQVETTPVGGPSSAQLEQQDQTRDEQREIVSDLDSSIRDAQAQKQQPMEKLLRDMRGAVSTRTPEDKGDGKLADQFQRAGDELLRNQDSFGGGDKAKLPDVFGKAVDFLRTAFVDKEQPKAEGKRTTSSSQVPVIADKANVGEANLALDRRVETRDPRVTTFLQQYFGDGFEAKPQRTFTDKQLVAALPQTEREAFGKLPAAEQKFLLALDSKQQGAYASMPKEEQTFFRGMKPSERGQYLAMSPDERAFFRDLKPDERANYVALHPDQREVLRQEGPEGRKALVAPEQVKQLKTKDPVEVAKEISKDVLQVFGHELKDTPDATGKTSQLREKTQQLMMNFLQAEPGNIAHARMQTIKALMEAPEFQNQLMSELEGRLNQQDQSSGAQGNQSVAAHFKKIRPLVMQQAQKLIRPDMSRESLLGGLSKAVEISAGFAAAHPPRRRDLRVSGNLQFRYIAG